MRRLSIDIETYSSIDIMKSGVYKYVESPDFTILLFAYAYDDGPIKIIDLAQGEEIPPSIYTDLESKQITKSAFNANFEITCLDEMARRSNPNYPPLDVSQWECTMVHAMCLGLPGSLDSVAKALKLGEQKDTAGKNLIKYFSMPCKPTKANGGRTRNLPEHDLTKWEQYKNYCIQDVEVERAIKNKIENYYQISDTEHKLWGLDQQINKTGISINPMLVQNAIDCDLLQKEKIMAEARKISLLNNPNSGTQVKEWLFTYEGLKITSLTKDTIPDIINQVKNESSKKFLELYQELSKTSVKKYDSMGNSMCGDNRVKGLLQFYGASRTGRWAGRLIQVHNLPQNKMKELDEARTFLLQGNYEAMHMLYPSVSKVLSELIRTAFVPKQGCKFLISDFSAIEARVIAWLADEKWRMDVFNTHGKIYEASASQMFKVPIDEVTKGSPLRQKGKVSELALGYQGGAGALITMGALNMGLSEDELPELVETWRLANPKIVRLWKLVESSAIKAIEEKTITKINHNVSFIYRYGNLYINLPSGRQLCYLSAVIGRGAKFGNKVIQFQGINQTTKQFVTQETYGGKLVENIIQAIARDCLAVAMTRLDKAGYGIVMHVHDEVVMEVPENETHLETVNQIMALPIDWAEGLPLKGDSFETMYYMKD